MNKILLLIPVLLFILISTISCGNRCKNCHYAIEFSNESNRDVYIDWARTYPDTIDHLLYSISPAISAIANKKKYVLARTKGHLSHGSYWEPLFKDGNMNPDNVLMIIIFNVEAVDSTNWKTIDWSIPANYDKYILQRYDLSLQDIELLNWNIPYPPMEKMRDMKMYPPYSSYEK